MSASPNNPKLYTFRIGNRAAVLTILSCDPDEPEIEVQLRGFGVQIVDFEIAPTFLEFGEVVTGTTTSRTLTMTHLDDESFVPEVSFESGVSAPWEFPPEIGTPVPAGGEIELTLNFTPVIPGLLEETVVITKPGGTTTWFIGATANVVSDGGGQLPGDCTQDDTLDLSDGLCLLGYLFLGEPLAVLWDSGRDSGTGRG